MPIKTISSREFNQNAGKAKKAATNGPVFITDRGRPKHVLLSVEDYRRLTGGIRNIADALAMPGGEKMEFNPPKFSIDLPGGLGMMFITDKKRHQASRNDSEVVGEPGHAEMAEAQMAETQGGANMSTIGEGVTRRGDMTWSEFQRSMASRRQELATRQKHEDIAVYLLGALLGAVVLLVRWIL